MNATLFATLAVRAGDLGVYGTFGSRADAAVAADWQTGEDTYAQPIALHPPETDPLITRATAELTGDVLELPARVADLLAAHDPDPDPAGAVVVSLLIDPPARRLALFVGPFTTVTEARAWIGGAAGTSPLGIYRAGLRIHPLHRTDQVPAATAAPGPDPAPVAADRGPEVTVRLEVTPTTPDPAKGTRSLADLRVAEGLGREAAVLIADGAIGAVPMRMPPGAWALLVTAADRSAASGEVVLFAGEWCEHAYPATWCEGDLVLRLAPPAAAEADTEGDAVAVRLTVAEDGRWLPAGTWPRLGRDWPAVVAPAAAAILGTSIDAAEADPPTSRPKRVNEHKSTMDGSTASG